MERTSRDLVVVDVGCRWGFADMWSQLPNPVRLYGFDPDEEECERLARDHDPAKATLVPKGLAESPGKKRLYLTENSGCSSLYRPDPKLTSTMPELACAKEVGVTEIDVTTLDLWSSSEGVDAVDFMKLDTQGSELDILRGGVELLRTVRALEIEVEFNPIYENQPLFADVDKFLREQGFVLWRLSNMVHYAEREFMHQPQKDDISYYDSKPVTHPTLSGQLYWGHAHYLKSDLAAGMKHNDPDQCSRDVELMKALGFNDVALRLA